MYDDYADDPLDTTYDTYNDASSFDETYDGDWSGAPARGGGLAASKVWIALLVGALVIGGGAALVYFLRGPNASPVATTQAFYDSLNRRDFETTAALLDPAYGFSADTFERGGSLIDFLLPLLTDELLGEFGIETPEFLSDILGDIQWEFRDMTYTLVNEEGDRATVRAAGELYLAVLGFEMPVPFDIPHELVRIDGRWYLQLGF